MRPFALLSGFGFWLVLACGGGGSSASEANALFPQNDSAENLQGLLNKIVSSNESGDTKTAATLTRGLLPDRPSLFKALRDDAPAAFVDKTLAMGAALPADDASAAGVIQRGESARTEIHAYASTTEEINTYGNGSVAFMEFPGGTRRLASDVLRPGVTFYEVEFVEPGQDSGMKYHMFYWDGGAWKMLGPAWRSLD